MIEKIVSGGQTGVDQAALAMASEAGLEIGGWCPKGGLDANGVCVLKTFSIIRSYSALAAKIALVVCKSGRLQTSITSIFIFP